MKRIALFAALAVLALAPVAGASNISLVATAVTPVDGAAPVGVAGDSATGWDSGSWRAAGGGYTQFQASSQLLFGRTITVGELESVSYFTKKDTSHVVSAPDWFFQFYTAPYPEQPLAGKWYGGRFNSEPYFAANMSENVGGWNFWQSDSGSNQLRFYDSTMNYFGSYQDGFLSDLTSNATYRDQSVMYFVVGTGSGWANGFEGQLDGLTIQLKNGDTATVNFDAQPVPEPATMTLLGIGLVGAFRASRRRK